MIKDLNTFVMLVPYVVTDVICINTSHSTDLDAEKQWVISCTQNLDISVNNIY